MLKYSSWAFYCTSFCVSSCFHCWDTHIWNLSMWSLISNPITFVWRPAVLYYWNILRLKFHACKNSASSVHKHVTVFTIAEMEARAWDRHLVWNTGFGIGIVLSNARSPHCPDSLRYSPAMTVINSRNQFRPGKSTKIGGSAVFMEGFLDSALLCEITRHRT